ncbi:MAG: DUF3365 domain-containing protein [Desulfobacteraceae bacterium]|nr:DUF3365 domain-containing protein [Desulfobacteraceae bacterium]
MLTQRISKDSLTSVKALSEQEDAKIAISVVTAARKQMAKTIQGIKTHAKDRDWTFKLTKESLGFLPATVGTAIGDSVSHKTSFNATNKFKISKLQK